ncbi:hypothetical protein [uncultured Ruegeria sp.]|uniref:hypothetical protein n=1 Tax=uncultured Ruegeria sp. TaxID=259304 RepID=UPI00261E88DF|nr:hypothetical protein [uncultured Ruegeria sp.]
MTPTVIFLLQFAMSLFVFAQIAAWYVAPWLARLSAAAALSILLLPHAFRHIGMSFLVPNLNNGGLPEAFATSASYGDLLSAFLAIAALIALRWGSVAALPLVWGFNILGTVDLVNALRQAEAINYFGPTWFIPTFFVPVLLVTHVMIFARLLKAEWPKMAST